MKGRESVMPGQANWDSFFNAPVAIDLLFGSHLIGDIVEFGCGYGTFTIPAARRASGTVAALDIDSEMVELTRSKATGLGLANVRTEVRDFIADGTGLAPSSQSHAMIYNLLHIEDPLALLNEAWRTLDADGVLSVMHWRSDIPTPRGPPLDIRPLPKQCEAWMIKAGFEKIVPIHLAGACPYHFALTGTKVGL